MGKLISKTEAAEQLGCSERKIEDWLQHGLLRGHYIQRSKHSSKPYLYVDSDSIDAIQDSVEETRLLQVAVTKENELLEQKLRDIRGAARIDYFPVRTLLEKMLNAFYDTEFCPPRSIDIMRNIILNGKSYQEVADDLGVSKSRIGQIFERETRRLANRLCWLRKAADDKRTLQKENVALRQENEVLWAKVATYDAAEAAKMEQDALRRDFLATPLKEFDLSVRALNCLKAAKINTVGDLTHHKRSDLLKFRNFGKKSLTELDEFLQRHELTWNK